MNWYANPQIVRQLPLGLRIWAAYARAVTTNAGRIPGGSFLYRALSRLAQWLGPSKETLVDVNGQLLFLDMSDPDATRALNTLYRHPAECRLVAEVLQDGDTFLDIGANYGVFSLIAASRVGPAGTVYAFEPQPCLAALIRKTLAANGMSNAQVWEVACGDCSGMTFLYVPRWSSGRASLHRRYIQQYSRPRTIPVSTARLDDIVTSEKHGRRVVMKLDVEGNELNVLRGAEKLIKRHHPILLFELNPAALAANAATIDDLLDLVCKYGYSRFSTPDGFPERIDRAAIPRDTGCDMVALR